MKKWIWDLAWVARPARGSCGGFAKTWIWGLGGYRRRLVGPVAALAQPRIARDADGLPRSADEAERGHDFAECVSGGAVGKEGHAGRFRLKSVG